MFYSHTGNLGGVEIESGNDTNAVQDIESGIMLANISDTMSVSHFRNGSEDEEHHADLTDVDIHINDVSNGYSSFQQLGGAVDEILVMNILVYLNAGELASLSLTNRYFCKLCQTTIIWNALYRRDFIIDDSMEQSETASQLSLRPTLHSLITTHPTITSYTKTLYIRRFNEYNQRIEHAKEEAQQSIIAARHSARVHIIENILDITQIRILSSLFIGSIILTIILFCQKIDGLKISYWLCFLPLLISFLYILLSLLLLRYLEIYNTSTTNYLRGLYTNFRSPLNFIYQEVCNRQKSLLYLIILFIIISIIQILLIIFKLSPTIIVGLNHHSFSWSMVFIPIWLLLLLYCCLPCLTGNIEAGPYIATIILFYIPILIYFICLCIKLTGIDDNSSYRKMRLALILIPFWVIEGCFMLGTLAFFIFGLKE